MDELTMENIIELCAAQLSSNVNLLKGHLLKTFKLLTDYIRRWLTFSSSTEPLRRKCVNIDKLLDLFQIWWDYYIALRDEFCFCQYGIISREYLRERCVKFVEADFFETDIDIAPCSCEGICALVDSIEVMSDSCFSHLTNTRCFVQFP
jgi:hypothetical protein